MMKSIKLSLLALGMSFNMVVIAASTMDSTTGAEGNLYRPNSSDTSRMRDCNARTGNDRIMCEKESQNDAGRSLPSESGRIKRNNDGNMIDDRKSKDLQSRDSEINNSQRLDSQGLDSQARDSQARDSQPSDTIPRNSNPSSSGSYGSGTGTLNAK